MYVLTEIYYLFTVELAEKLLYLALYPHMEWFYLKQLKIFKESSR